MAREQLIESIQKALDDIKDIMFHEQLKDDGNDIPADFYKCKDAYNILCSILVEYRMDNMD